MKNLKFWDNLLIVLGFLAALTSAITNYVNGRDFGWQVACLFWVATCFLKQRTIDMLKNKS